MHGWPSELDRFFGSVVKLSYEVNVLPEKEGQPEKAVNSAQA
ncbi:MAG: hypothetical protein ABIJ10_03545 [Candidatus Micrarchaeota archaeon]